MILPFKEQFVDKILRIEKNHTIRLDEKNRWKEGCLIHMATGVRSKNYRQFNVNRRELSMCKRVQQIEIIRCDDLPRSQYDGSEYIYDYYSDQLKETFQLVFKIKIDSRYLNLAEITNLSYYDGFNCPEDLFEWFNLRSFKGKLIHWTEFKY